MFPSATDVWAVLGQTAGVRMRGYDVGGSHKSQQSGYESFGIRDQNRVMSEGVDSTEGTGGTGFYYSYYSIEEFTTAAAGADVEMTTPGSMVMMTVKSGGNVFSGMIHMDYEGETMVSNNVDNALRAARLHGQPEPVVLGVPRRRGRSHRPRPCLVLRLLRPLQDRQADLGCRPEHRHRHR